MNTVVGFIALTAFKAIICDAAFFSDVSWSTGIQLAEYNGYRSASILTYDVPQQAVEAWFTFDARTKGSSCPNRDVHIFLQHGSYPLLKSLGEAFPANFYINRTSAFYFVVKTNGNAVWLNISSPLPGPWYIATFLMKQSDKIQPKEFEKSCQHGLFFSIETTGLDSVMEISVEKVTPVHLSQQPGNENVLYRFMLADDVVEYTVNITGCAGLQKVSENNVSSMDTATVSENEHDTFAKPNGAAHEPEVLLFPSCPVIVRLSSSKMPFSKSDNKVYCGNMTECNITVLSPAVKQWSYIFIQIDDAYNVSSLQFNLQMEQKGCKSLNQTSFEHIHTTVQDLESPGDVPLFVQDLCVKMNSLGRFTSDEEIFSTTYMIPEFSEASSSMPFRNSSEIPSSAPLHNISVPDNEVLVTGIEIQPFIDSGGTLMMSANLNKTSYNDTSYDVLVYICLLKNSLPGGVTVQTCDNGLQLVLNTSLEKLNDIIYMPYPEAGSWYLGLSSICLDKTSIKPVRCEQLPVINMELRIKGCVDGECGEYGVCQNYISGVLIFSSCKCFGGWRGYGCTDGSQARSRQHELLAVMLLTLSNLFFIPAIILAVYRHFFVEAAVYFYTMFFSLFYHACDASDLIQYCMLKYGTLSFTDYLGSISAFWVTLLAIADIPTKVRAFLFTLGALGMAVGVENDQQGILKFAVPASVAGLIMVASWVRQCVKRKKVHPDKKYLLYHLLPGGLLALTGLVLFFTLETEDNYMYTHSAWHMTISLSIVFLLPKRRKDGIKGEDPDTEVVLTDPSDREDSPCQGP